MQLVYSWWNRTQARSWQYVLLYCYIVLPILLCMFFHCSAAGNMGSDCLRELLSEQNNTIGFDSAHFPSTWRTRGNALRAKFAKKSFQPFSRSFQLKFSKGAWSPFSSHWRGTQLKSFKPPSRNSKKPLLVLSFATNLADSPSAELIEAEKVDTIWNWQKHRLDCCDKK